MHTRTVLAALFATAVLAVSLAACDQMGSSGPPAIGTSQYGGGGGGMGGGGGGGGGGGY